MLVGKSSKEDISCQCIHSIKIEKLKGIFDLDLLSLEPKQMTAILGPNGCGKSTILHALASIYMPKKDQAGDNYKLINFFPSNPDSRWNGSKFSVVISYRNGKEMIDHEVNIYGKGDEKGSRWIKQYARRPKREVYYLGVDKCVPMIETEKKANFSYTTTDFPEYESDNILDSASYVLSKRYISADKHILSNGKILMRVGVEGIQYSSLSMSAGEQKVFQILTTMFNAGKNSLVLIDEIDILLHEDALKKLLLKINTISESKKLQVVFTTHRESVINLSDKINIRHLFQEGERMYVLENSTPDAINRITGKKYSPVEIYIEDDLSHAVIRKVCAMQGCSRYIKCIKFGAAVNCFTILGASLIKGEDISNNVYILDGDVYKTNEERMKAIKSTITGSSPRSSELRERSLEYVKQYNIPDKMNPEQFIKSILDSISIGDDLLEDEKEIIDAAHRIFYDEDKHNYLNLIIEELGYSIETGFDKILDIFYRKRREQWDDYVREVGDYLTPILRKFRNDLA